MLLDYKSRLLDTSLTFSFTAGLFWFILFYFFTNFCDILSHFLLLHFCINPDPNDHKKDEAVDRLSEEGLTSLFHCIMFDVLVGISPISAFYIFISFPPISKTSASFFLSFFLLLGLTFSSIFGRWIAFPSL